MTTAPATNCIQPPLVAKSILGKRKAEDPPVGPAKKKCRIRTDAQFQAARSRRERATVDRAMTQLADLSSDSFKFIDFCHLPMWAGYGAEQVYRSSYIIYLSHFFCFLHFRFFHFFCFSYF